MRIRNQLLLAALGVVGLALVVRRGHRRTGMFLLIAAVGSEIMVDVAKRVVERHRPPIVLHLDPMTNGAFPSGHAFNAMVVVGAVLVAWWHVRGRPPARWIWVLGALVPFVVGLTRVYLGVHWITDVIAGWLLGALWVALLARIWLGDLPRRSAGSQRGASE